MTETLLGIGERVCDWPLMSAIAGPKPQRSAFLPAVTSAFLLLVLFSLFLLALMLIIPSFATIRMVYNFHTLLLPAILGCTAVCGMAYWNRHPYERGVLRASVLFLAATIGLFAVRIYATHIEPHRLQVKRVTIQTSKAHHPFRILHISDIQSAQVGEYEQEVFERIRELAPDLVIFTGDLLQPLPPATWQTEAPKISALFSSLSPSNGTLGVRGDVDEFLVDHPDAIPGIEWLNNRSTRIRTDAATINILSLASENSRNGRCASTISKWLSGTEPDEFTLIMSHAPDFILQAADMPVDLCLAGHTHGGQIRLPLIGPLVTLSKAPRDLCRGFNIVGKTRLNVSAGIGCEHASGIPALRINCPPEMTLIELVPEPTPKPAAKEAV